MSAYSEAIALEDALPRTGSVPWEIGKVYNALLAAAKREQPDSISLGALDPLGTQHRRLCPQRHRGESADGWSPSSAAALKPPSSG